MRYLILLFFVVSVHAASSDYPTPRQRGAQLFMDYCSGCHTLRYMRYNRMISDLGLTRVDGRAINSLIVHQASTHDLTRVSMPEIDARQWFGRVPPDLSLMARERGVEWLYAYLNGFYADARRPFGANNIWSKDVAMPNVLAPLQGDVHAGRVDFAGNPSLVLVARGTLNQQQFAEATGDLVAFLDYVAEPAKLVRYQIGLFVMAFLCVFLIVVYLLFRILSTKR